MSRVRGSLLLITDGRLAEDRLQAALAAVPPGSVAVQLRNRTLGGAELLHLSERLRTLTDRYGASLLINDRFDVALLVGADGVHLPGHGLPPAAVRALVGNRLLISAASHSLSEAQALVESGADCVTLGPIWPTPSKPDDPALPAAERVHPLGLAALEGAVRAVSAPIFALGGIDTPARAAACAAVGARIACLRGVLLADDPAAAARAFAEAARRSG